MEQSLVELNQKIDLLSEQLAYLTDQAQAMERQRLGRSELVNDLTPILNQAFGMAVEEFEEIQEYIDLRDLLRLMKRLLRNGRNFERMLDQLESLQDMFGTAGPLTDQAFSRIVTLLSELEEKGYFTFAKGGIRIVDNVVTSFAAEDVEHLGDNIVLILNTIKDMTQPEIMKFVRNTLMVAEKEIDKEVDISYPGLIRQMRDPEVRRGLALTMRVLHVIGAQAAGNGFTPTENN